MVEKDAQNLTDDETALYDRQIRLWGLDAQKRLRAANVLLIGLGGVGAEVAKNIVLSGIHSLTLLDNHVVTAESACSQFLLDTTDIGKNRATASVTRTQQLNPMVAVTADTAGVDAKPDAYFSQFAVVCATGCSCQQLLRLNDVCHRAGCAFFAADVFGYYGYSFADLGEHKFAEEVLQHRKPSSGDGEPASKKTKIEPAETVVVKKTTNFTRLKDALTIDWSSEDMVKKLKKTPKTFFIVRVLLEFRNKYDRDPAISSLQTDKDLLAELRQTVTQQMKVDESVVAEDFFNHCFAELSPVCAIVGGVLGQEIIKAVSQKDPPHNNFFFFNGIDGSGMVDRIA